MEQRQQMLIPSIYVDLDDVIAETLRAFARVANGMFGRTIHFSEIYSFDLGKSFKLCPAELKAFMEAAHSREILLNEIAANPEARATLGEWASRGTYITVVTGRPTSTYQVTLEWLRRNEIPFHALRFLRKYGRNDIGEGQVRPLALRTLPYAGFLFSVEDSLKMADYLANRAHVPVLLLDKPWNRAGYTDASHDLVTRCKNWDVIKAKSLSYLETVRLRHTG